MDLQPTYKNKILIIDDDERIVSLLIQILNNTESYNAIGACDASNARAILLEHNNNFDAMIVDCMMPNESGIEFIRSIRSGGNEIPSILLTAIDTVDNKILGFEGGADDYLTKPFDERELMARLKRLIEKSKKKDIYNDNIVFFGNCEFNMNNAELTIDGVSIYLTSTEKSLLTSLCQKCGLPVAREDLAKKLGFIVSDRTIDVQITRLRRKIGDNPKNPTIIQTIRYIGYSIKLSRKPL